MFFAISLILTLYLLLKVVDFYWRGSVKRERKQPDYRFAFSTAKPLFRPALLRPRFMQLLCRLIFRWRGNESEPDCFDPCRHSLLFLASYHAFSTRFASLAASWAEMIARFFRRLSPKSEPLPESVDPSFIIRHLLYSGQPLWNIQTFSCRSSLRRSARS